MGAHIAPLVRIRDLFIIFHLTFCGLLSVSVSIAYTVLPVDASRRLARHINKFAGTFIGTNIKKRAVQAPLLLLLIEY